MANYSPTRGLQLWRNKPTQRTGFQFFWLQKNAMRNHKSTLENGQKQIVATYEMKSKCSYNRALI